MLEADFVEQSDGIVCLETCLRLQLHHLSMHSVKLREVDLEGLSAVVEILRRLSVEAASVVLVGSREVVFHEFRECFERQLVGGLDPRNNLHVARADFLLGHHLVLLLDEAVVVLVHLLGDDDRLTFFVVTALFWRHIDFHRMKVLTVRRKHLDFFLDCSLHGRLLLLTLRLGEESLRDVAELLG